jgi:hypothetical protein
MAVEKIKKMYGIVIIRPDPKKSPPDRVKKYQLIKGAVIAMGK